MAPPPSDPIKRFFDVVLPALVLKQFNEFIEQEGCLTFDVTDVGQWTFTWGTEEPVKPGIDPEAGLKLTFTKAAFEKFIDGTLDVMTAVQTRAITAKGRDFMLLETFGRILRPPQKHDMGWDAQTVG